MSYRNPIEFTVNNPRLLDIVCTEIQNVFANNIDWLETSFSRAEIQSKLVNGTKVFFPEVQQIYTLDYYNAFPNDNLVAHSFVFPVGEDEIVDSNFHSKGFKIETPIAIIFAIQQLKVDSGSYGSNIKYPIIQEVTEIIKTKLRKLDLVNSTHKVGEVWAEFTLDEFKPEFMDNNKWIHLRFNCVARYDNNCNLPVIDFDGDFTFDPFADYSFIYSSETFLTY